MRPLTQEEMDELFQAGFNSPESRSMPAGLGEGIMGDMGNGSTNSMLGLLLGQGLMPAAQEEEFEGYADGKMYAGGNMFPEWGSSRGGEGLGPKVPKIVDRPSPVGPPAGMGSSGRNMRPEAGGLPLFLRGKTR